MAFWTHARAVPSVAQQERRHSEHPHCLLRPQRQATLGNGVLHRYVGGRGDTQLYHHAEHLRSVRLLRGNQSIEMRPWRGGQDRPTGLPLEWDIGKALVDIYIKRGDLAGATRAFDMMPGKDVLTWNSMIGALG